MADKEIPNEVTEAAMQESEDMIKGKIKKLYTFADYMEKLPPEERERIERMAKKIGRRQKVRKAKELNRLVKAKNAPLSECIPEDKVKW